MKLKIAACILFFIQLVSLVGGILMGEDFSGHVISWYAGRFIFGLVGLFLLLLAWKKDFE